MKLTNQNVQMSPLSPLYKVVPFAIIALWTAAGAAVAQQSAQPAFPSVSEAAQSLFQAVQSNNEQAVIKILGGQTELTSSADPDRDRLDREVFIDKYQEMHRLSRDADGSVTLYLGAENWPFPIPLVNENGAWHFDPVAGQREVLYRRIGENELTAVAACREFVETENHSLAGSNANSSDTALASLVTKGPGNLGGGDPVLYHGYYFRLLPMASAKGKTAGGFTLIAYPAEYRSSGVMTFVAGANGVVYEKDLGANTSTLASAMATFHKDVTWRPTEE